jgi:hypothetical protein
MDVIAQRREEMNHVDEMKDSLYKQHLHVYDKDRVAQDDETADKQCAREAKAKADSLQPPIYANQQQLDQGHENMELKAQLAAALAIIKAKEINDNQS